MAKPPAKKPRKAKAPKITHRSAIEMASRTRSKKALKAYREYQREYHRQRRERLRQENS